MSSVLWLTNLYAPYRVPVWNSLAREFDLSIGLTESPRGTEANRRSSDWLPPVLGQTKDFDVVMLDRPSIEVRAQRFGLLSPRSRRIIPVDGAVILGGWESPVYWQALCLAKRRNSRTIGFYESTSLTQRFSAGPISRARERFLRSLDAVVVPGAAAREAVVRAGVEPGRISMGFNSIDATRFRRTGAEGAASIGHKFVYVGQMISRKNVGALLEAFQIVAEPADTLTLVGSGEYLPMLRAQVEGDSRVHFLGAALANEIPDIVKAAQTLVLPSREEVWGLVVNEALTAGLHAVVSRNCGVAVSVEGMKGVYLTGLGSEDLALSMAKSRAEWGGWIKSPEIMLYSPERFAAVFASAIRG